MNADSVQAVATSPQTAHVVSAVTTTTGVATWVQMIPHDIGTIGSLLGIVSTVVLLIIQIKRDRRDQKRFEMEVRERRRVPRG